MYSIRVFTSASHTSWTLDVFPRLVIPRDYYIQAYVWGCVRYLGTGVLCKISRHWNTKKIYPRTRILFPGIQMLRNIYICTIILKGIPRDLNIMYDVQGREYYVVHGCYAIYPGRHVWRTSYRETTYDISRHRTSVKSTAVTAMTSRSFIAMREHNLTFNLHSHPRHAYISRHLCIYNPEHRW